MLKRVGINVLLLGWLSDYLTNMQQRVVIVLYIRGLFKYECK